MRDERRGKIQLALKADKSEPKVERVSHDSSKIANLEKSLERKSAELRNLQEGIRLLTHDSNRQLAEAKMRLKCVEEEAQTFACKLKDILCGTRGAHLSVTVSESLSPRIRYNDKAVCMDTGFRRSHVTPSAHSSDSVGLRTHAKPLPLQ